MELSIGGGALRAMGLLSPKERGTSALRAIGAPIHRLGLRIAVGHRQHGPFGGDAGSVEGTDGDFGVRNAEP